MCIWKPTRHGERARRTVAREARAATVPDLRPANERYSNLFFSARQGRDPRTVCDCWLSERSAGGLREHRLQLAPHCPTNQGSRSGFVAAEREYITTCIHHTYDNTC